VWPVGAVHIREGQRAAQGRIPGRQAIHETDDHAGRQRLRSRADRSCDRSVECAAPAGGPHADPVSVVSTWYRAAPRMSALLGGAPEVKDVDEVHHTLVA